MANNQTATKVQSDFIVFSTETLLDIRAITTFGLNAKPNTKSPIGYFGTGLKMAIAVLLRHKVPISLYIGTTEYEFYLKQEDFRGKEYQQVMMRKRNGMLKNWFAQALPFTTELAKNWELWQAFRELESNTRDEGGETSIHFLLNFKPIVPSTGHTLFIVGPSHSFAEIYGNRDKYFLPEASREYELYKSHSIEIFRRPSDAIYYRGIRIFELKKPSIFTYNILRPIELTEDRTAKYEWDLKSAVQAFLANQEDRGIINQLLNATEDHWESTLDWDDSWSSAPSPVFKDILARRIAKSKGTSTSLAPRFTGYYRTHTPAPPTSEIPMKTKFRDWADDCDIYNKISQEQVDKFDELLAELERRMS